MPWVNYKKKPQAPPTWEYQAKAVELDELAGYLKQKRADRWKIEHVAPMSDNTVLVVSVQSSQYAPKVKAAKKPKAKKPKPVEAEPELDLTASSPLPESR